MNEPILTPAQEIKFLEQVKSEANQTASDAARRIAEIEAANAPTVVDAAEGRDRSEVVEMTGKAIGGAFLPKS